MIARTANRATGFVAVLLAGLFLAAPFGCGGHEDTATPPDTAAPAPETEPVLSEPAQPHTPPDPAASPAEPNELPGIVARLGDSEITREEYLAEAVQLRERLFAQRTGQAPIPNMSRLPELTEEQKASVINAMIEARIFGELAEESGIEISTDEIDAQLQEIKGQLVTESAYQSLLQQSETSEEAFRESIRLRLLMETYGDSLVPEMKYTEGQLEQAYTRLKEQGAMRQPKTADIVHIFLPVTSAGEPASETEAKEHIEVIRQRILGGEDFQAVAKEVSQDSVSASRGGLYEDVRKGQMGQGFDDRLFAMPLNEVSEPFRSLKGWHILKVLERHEPRELTLEEATPAIEKMLHAARRNEAMARKVAEVRPTMDIELFMDFDLRQGNQEQVIPVPADAVTNPDALPESIRPPADAAPNDVPPAPEPPPGTE